MNPSRLESRCLNMVDRYLQSISIGRLEMVLPDGSLRMYGDDTPAVSIRVERYRFFTRLVTSGDIGLGEAWTDGDWDSNQLVEVLQLFIHNLNSMRTLGLRARMGQRLLGMVRHTMNRNTRRGSRRNIRAHYDLGNNFYQLFLDPETMMYSSALFNVPDLTLGEAQKRKIERLIELADIQPEHHMLEIGCGWGGFAIEAARVAGCEITAITISEAQYNFARARVAEAGLRDRVHIVLSDYRDHQGQYDRVVSIEMLEAVGHAYYGNFFATCDRLLKPGGRVALQVITIPDQRYAAYRKNPDWIQKHIFPGGMLPSLTELTRAMTSHSRFIVDHLDNFGPDYAETLRRWRTNFLEHTETLEELGFDETFRRKWIYYFCYCEAGFQTQITNNLHFVLRRPGSR